jgi:ribonuclease PH
MPFTADELQAMLDLGRKGIEEIVATQRRILAQAGEEPRQLRG